MTKCNTIPDNAILQLSCKFDESKWNPYWVNMLTSSSGIDYVLNAMLELSWKFCESKWNPYWVIALTSLSGTDHILNEHEDVDQYG